ncbi:MAG TPA: hypothetical protein VLG44_07090 [Chlamydiales bacterium]|nr:hypothetical protein [Chlamydiales bacterium]
MRILFAFLFILLTSTLSARLTECTFGIGYRNDRIKTNHAGFHIKEHDLESLLEFIRVETVAEHLLLGVDVDYGILLKGKREINDLAYKDDYGYEADVFPKVGYSFTLTDFFYFDISGGYGYSRVSLRTKSELPLFDTSSFLYEWYGPFVEGKLDLFQACRWKVAGFYQYHFLRGKIQQPLFMLGEGDIPLKTKIRSAYKQVGGLSVYYLPIDFATLGFEGMVMKGQSTKPRHTESFFNYSVLMSVLLWF